MNSLGSVFNSFYELSTSYQHSYQQSLLITYCRKWKGSGISSWTFPIWNPLEVHILPSVGSLVAEDITAWLCKFHNLQVVHIIHNFLCSWEAQLAGDCHKRLVGLLVRIVRVSKHTGSELPHFTSGFICLGKLANLRKSRRLQESLIPWFCLSWMVILLVAIVLNCSFSKSLI